MNKISFAFLIAICSLCLSPFTSGQDTIRMKRLANQVEFDGSPFEAAWNGLEYFPMTMFKPNYGAEPSEISEVMIAYDDQYVWVGARLYMKDAGKIAVTSKKRDDQPRSPDHFCVLFDTYNDNENGLVFFTNPTGARTDYAISNDAVGGGLNFSWNTFWDVKTTRDDKGWYVEMRIPFSSLRFKPQDNITTMGIIFKRCFSSNSEIDTYPPVDPKYGIMAIAKPSLATTIEFEGAKPSMPVYVSPYIIGGNSRNWVLNDIGTKYVNKDNPDLNAGLDVKYNINSNLTLDLTVNTDFAQVEADDQQVNLTRYSLYFPEKRMFFQERSSLFNYSLGGNSSLFYSRNIGISNGESVRIYGGARMVGRVGKWDMGLMDMQTEEHDATPGQNFGVLRMRKQVFNPYSYIGGMLTSKIGMNGTKNFAYGLDGIFRLFGDDYLDVKVAQTYDDVMANKINSIDPMYFMAKWDNRSDKGFSYELGYSFTGREFKPGVGFVNMGGLQGFAGNILYGWLPGPKSKIFNTKVIVNVSRYSRLEDGMLESFSLKPNWTLLTKKNYTAEVSIEYMKEGVLHDFSITDSIWVPSGNYSFTEGTFSFSTPSSKSLYASLSIHGGGFYGGTRYGFAFKPAFDVSSSLQLSASYQFNHITFPDRNREVNIHIAYAKILYMLSTKLSATVFVQYVSTTSDVIANFRLRYNPREGNDFYLVFNDYRGINREDFEPTLPNYFNRTILLKYTHTFRL
jgi:hypothetical protein